MFEAIVRSCSRLITWVTTLEHVQILGGGGSNGRKRPLSVASERNLKSSLGGMATGDLSTAASTTSEMTTPTPSSSFILTRLPDSGASPNTAPGGSTSKASANGGSQPYSVLSDEARRSMYLSNPPTSPSPSGAPMDDIATVSNIGLSSHLSRSSASGISSTRPAPPSPTPSRRASGSPIVVSRSRPASSALSTTSSKSRRGVTADSTSSSKRLKSKKSLLAAAIVKVRDFAFPASDERHLGTIVVQPSRNSTQSTASRWSGFAARFGLFSSGDKHRSHDSMKRSSGLSSAIAGRDDGDQGEDDDEGSETDEVQFDEPGVDHELEPFIPGIYRAMYAFTPEGPSEMALDEDQLVSVLGRGGGSGWVVVAKDNHGGQALVPEGYLEFNSEFAEGTDDASLGERGARSDTPRG